MLAWMTKKQQPAAAAAAPAKPTAPFIKAAKFGGAKDGYAFKSGALGPGYYLDSSATGSAKAKAKRAAPPAKKEKAGSAMSKSAMSKDALRVRSPPRSACPRVLGGAGSCSPSGSSPPCALCRRAFVLTSAGVWHCGAAAAAGEGGGGGGAGERRVGGCRSAQRTGTRSAAGREARAQGRRGGRLRGGTHVHERDRRGGGAERERGRGEPYGTAQMW